MEKLKKAVYHSILKLNDNPTMEELIDKYEDILNKYCFDKENKAIIDIHILKLILEAFEFYYMIINARELEKVDDQKLREYQYDHCYEIRNKSDLDLTKCDYIYLYSTMLTEQYGKEFVNENEELFKKMIMISKILKDYEKLIRVKSQLS